MRWYDADIVSGILLILIIIDSALTFPIPVQEKGQAHIDVVHIPKDVITVSMKRGIEELETMMDGLFSKTWENPIGSSDAHASTSSPSPVPNLGSTNVDQAPAPTRNQAPLPPSWPDRKFEWTNVRQPLPSISEISEGPSPVPNPDHEPSSTKSLTGPAGGYESVEGNAPHGSSNELEAGHEHQVVRPPTENRPLSLARQKISNVAQWARTLGRRILKLFAIH